MAMKAWLPLALALVAGCVLGQILLTITWHRFAEDSQTTEDSGAYDRASWGTWHAADTKSLFGCTWSTRHLLLRDTGRDLETREEYGRPCMVLSGTWIDAYTGDVHSVPASEMHIDHLVSLSEARRSWAEPWSDDKKSKFFNDPDNLIVTHRTTNLRKSDIDPGGESHWGPREGWWPPDASVHCGYARQWMRAKNKWGLSADSDEHAALLAVSRTCPVLVGTVGEESP